MPLPLPPNASIKGVADSIGVSDGSAPNVGVGDGGTVHYNNLYGVPQSIVDLGNGTVLAHAQSHVNGSDAFTLLQTLNTNIAGSAGSAYYSS